MKPRRYKTSFTTPLLTDSRAFNLLKPLKSDISKMFLILTRCINVKSTEKYKLIQLLIVIKPDSYLEN